MHNLSCENEFYLHENEKWFPYQSLSTYPRFETEARGNSEMAYLPSTWSAKRQWANHGAYSNPGTRVRAEKKDFGAVLKTDLTSPQLLKRWITQSLSLILIRWIEICPLEGASLCDVWTIEARTLVSAVAVEKPGDKYVWRKIGWSGIKPMAVSNSLFSF